MVTILPSFIFSFSLRSVLAGKVVVRVTARWGRGMITKAGISSRWARAHLELSYVPCDVHSFYVCACDGLVRTMILLAFHHHAILLFVIAPV